MRALPLWATKDPSYHDALDQEMHRCSFESMSPASAVLQMKLCMRSACRHTVEKSLRRGARTIEEQIYWSLVCVRALFHGYATKAVRAMIAYPTLETFVLASTDDGTVMACDMEGLNAHISLLMRQSLERLRHDCEEVQYEPEYQKVRQRGAIQRMMDYWATRGRKASLQAARDEQGNVVIDPDQATAIYIAHWKQVAEEKTIDRRKARAFLSQHMRKIPNFPTVLVFERFVKLIRELPDSACGPDGIPYSA